MASFLQKLILMFKASDVQIVETVRNRREKSRDAVDIVGRYGYYKQVWLLLIGFGYSLAEQKKRNPKQRSKN